MNECLWAREDDEEEENTQTQEYGFNKGDMYKGGEHFRWM